MSEGPEEVGLDQLRLTWRRFKRHRPAVAGAVALAVVALASLLAPALAPSGFSQVNPAESLQAPSPEHLFGTDTLGRDQLARVLYGGRISLLVGIAVALSATLIGILVGAVSGFKGGSADELLMRTTDLFLSFPLLVVLITGARALGGSILDIVIILSVFGWMPVARIVRGVFLALREKEFVEAAQASGASNGRIVLKHLLPNAVAPIIVNATLTVAAAILTESVLSFLGFGIQPPTPTWGNLLSQSKDQYTTAPWLVWFPGLAILITVLAVNFLGDGLRDALDPQQARVRP